MRNAGSRPRHIVLHVLDQGLGFVIFADDVPDGANVHLDVIKMIEVRETKHRRMRHVE